MQDHAQIWLNINNACATSIQTRAAEINKLLIDRVSEWVGYNVPPDTV